MHDTIWLPKSLYSHSLTEDGVKLGLRGEHEHEHGWTEILLRNIPARLRSFPGGGKGRGGGGDHYALQYLCRINCPISEYFDSNRLRKHQHTVTVQWAAHCTNAAQWAGGAGQDTRTYLHRIGQVTQLELVFELLVDERLLAWVRKNKHAGL